MEETKHFDPHEKGRRIENIPHEGTQTGRYEIDLYGCWWEVEDDSGRMFWMIGEMPTPVAVKDTPLVYKVRIEGHKEYLFTGEVTTLYAGDGVLVAWMGYNTRTKAMVVTLVDCPKNKAIKVDLDEVGDLWLMTNSV